MTQELEVGQVQWHSSEEDGGPDVGVAVGLPGGLILWAGEISDRLHSEDSDGDGCPADLGENVGWWLVLFGRDSSTVIGRVLRYEAQGLLDVIANAVAPR